MIQSEDAKLLQALSDKTRIRIINLLMDSPLYVSQINSKLNIEQSLLSQHLKTLRSLGVVTCKRNGKYIEYSIAEEFKGENRSINLGCCELSFR